MLIDLEQKFRTQGLDESDCASLLCQIQTTDDYSKLLSLIYIFGRTCRETVAVADICRFYIANPEPGLTAVCLKVLVDYWGKWEENCAALETYLDMAVFEDWYDEVIFAASYVHRNQNLPFPATIFDRFRAIKDDPALRDVLPPSPDVA